MRNRTEAEQKKLRRSRRQSKEKRSEAIRRRSAFAQRHTRLCKIDGAAPLFLQPHPSERGPGSTRFAIRIQREEDRRAVRAQAALGVVMTERTRNLVAQGHFGERLLEQVAGTSMVYRLDHPVAAGGGQEEPGHGLLPLDRGGRREAIPGPGQMEVQQHQRRPQLARQGNGLFPGCSDAGDAVTPPPDLTGQIGGDAGFSFHDQDGRITNGWRSSLPLAPYTCYDPRPAPR